MQLQNRYGEPYYIKPKTTKTGKTTYTLTKKKSEDCLNRIPKGFEVYERPDTGIMYIRKIIPSKLTKKDKQILERQLKKNKALAGFSILEKGKIITIFITEQSQTERLGNIFGKYLNLKGGSLQLKALNRLQKYDARLQIKIEEKGKEKHYTFYRYCYRGVVDDWVVIGTGQDLKALAEKFIPHLGQDSYFEIDWFYE